MFGYTGVFICGRHWFSSLVPLSCSDILVEITTANFAAVHFATGTRDLADAKFCGRGCSFLVSLRGPVICSVVCEWCGPLKK